MTPSLSKATFDDNKVLRGLEDRRVWKLETSEMFSCRSLFKELTTVDGSLPFQHYSFVWKAPGLQSVSKLVCNV